MTEREESVDERLERLARATAGLGPSAGFGQRVMRRIEAEAGARAAPGWLAAVRSTSWRSLAVAAMAAVAGLVLAERSARSADEALAASYNAVEMEITW